MIAAAPIARVARRIASRGVGIGAVIRRLPRPGAAGFTSGRRFPVDFATVRRHRRPNDCLALPVGFEALSRPDFEIPLFDVPAARLDVAVRSLAGTRPRTVLAQADRVRRQYEYVQRSRVFGFPDRITVQVFDRGEEAAALAIWSRARYGIRDFGVNAARVRAWLKALPDHL